MIKRHLAGHLWSFLFACALSATSAVLSIRLLAYINTIATSGLAAAAPQVVHGALLLAGVFTASLSSKLLLARLSPAVVAGLQRDITRRFIALDYVRALKFKGSITHALVTDVLRVSMLLLLFPQFLLNVLVLCAGLVYLWSISPPLTLTFVVLGTLTASVSALALRRASRLFGGLRETEERLYEGFRAVEDGKKELLLSAARERHFSDEVLDRAISAHRQFAQTARSWLGSAESFASTMLFLTILTIVLSGRALFDVTSVAAAQFVVAVLFIYAPVNFLIGCGEQLSMGLSSVRNLRRLGADLPLPEAVSRLGAERGRLPRDWSRISAQGLTFEYASTDAGAFRFGPVDVNLHRGEITFIVGANGSGKSTLLLLLSGLLRPSAGTLCIDGQPLGEADMAEYRSLFAATFSDFYLFRQMLDHTGAAPSDALVEAWLGKVGVQDKVRSAGGALDTLQLSQGQRKRLALVQACLLDTEVFLFDEWAAEQDPQFRDYFYREFLAQLKHSGKTVIAITHDDAYFDFADRLVRLRNGSIADTEAPVHPPRAGLDSRAAQPLDA